MKVKELIDKYEAAECVVDFVSGKTLLKNIRRDLEQLDEPQPVKVPQFVDDVIKGAREQSPELEDALHYTWGNGTKEFTEWYNKKSNRDLFARAWLDGYEVEEEKQYTVVMKETKQPLYYNAGDKKLFFSLGGLATNFTRKQLEGAGFGWVFNCEGIEIEEVE
nr:MAG TPA: Protein of unknown function (DUF1642) [Caudoviricetes sp.]